jgi:hypothetical protein
MPDTPATEAPVAPATGTPPAPPVETPTPSPTPSPSPAPPEPPPSPPVTEFLDDQGAFTGDWKSLIPEDFRGRKVFDKFIDLPGLLGELGHLDLVVGRQGKGIMPLTDDATPTEVEKYYEALGRPKTAAEYEIKAPEGLEDYYDETLIKEAKEVLHKAGLTQKQVEAVMVMDAKRITEGIAELEVEKETDRKEAEDALRRKWGTAYDERLAMANRMVAENVAKEDEERVLGAIGNDPYVADFLANIARKFMEGGLIQAEPAGRPTPTEAESRMNELIAEQTRDPNMKMTNRAKYDRLNAEVMRLSAESLAGEKGTAGG